MYVDVFRREKAGEKDDFPRGRARAGGAIDWEFYNHEGRIVR